MFYLFLVHVTFWIWLLTDFSAQTAVGSVDSLHTRCRTVAQVIASMRPIGCHKVGEVFGSSTCMRWHSNGCPSMSAAHPTRQGRQSPDGCPPVVAPLVLVRTTGIPHKCPAVPLAVSSVRLLVLAFSILFFNYYALRLYIPYRVIYSAFLITISYVMVSEKVPPLEDTLLNE